MSELSALGYDRWRLMTPEENAALYGFHDEGEWFDEDETTLTCECCGDLLDEDTAIKDGPSWFCPECWESMEVNGLDENEAEKESA